MQLAFASLVFAGASLLIVLRIVAIWNKRVIIWISICIWMINIAFLIQGSVRVKFVWMSTEVTCATHDFDSVDLSFIVTLATDFVLLSIVLAGLLRLRRDGGGRFGVGKLLWKQGVVWFSLVLSAGIMQVVFCILDDTTPLDAIFQPVSLVTMSIVATRMHRSLVDFVTGSTLITSNSFQKGGLLFSKAKETRTSQTSSSQMQVAVHISYSEYPAPGISHPSPPISMDGQTDKTINESSVDDLASDLENEPHRILNVLNS